jgi:hypothetical protein
MDVENIVKILGLICRAVGGIHQILVKPRDGGKSQGSFFRGRKREEKNIGKIIHNLSHDELAFLFQFKQRQTTLLAFDRTNQIVRLLTTKGLIRPSYSALDCFDAPATYKTSNFNDNCQPFELTDITNKYLIEHPGVFDKILIASSLF